jgi:hypothetical protein
MGVERKVYKVLVGKPEGKKPLGRPGRRWEGWIRMDLSEIGFEGCVDWIRLAQDRDRWRAVVSAVMNLRVLAPRSLINLINLLKHEADLNNTVFENPVRTSKKTTRLYYEDQLVNSI